jgi:hypothetical protein
MLRVLCPVISMTVRLGNSQSDQAARCRAPQIVHGESAVAASLELAEANLSTQRIPILARLNNRRAVGVGEHEAIRRLAGDARCQQFS